MVRYEMDICSDLNSTVLGWILFYLSSSSCHVTVHLLVVHWLKDVVLTGAVVVACAGLDEHHLLLHDLTVRALELHGQSGGPVGGTAAAVRAHTTEFGAVGLGGGAAWDLKLHGLGDPWGANALLSFLQKTIRSGLRHVSLKVAHQTGQYSAMAFSPIHGDTPSYNFRSI